MISKKEKLSLVYFISNCFFLASGYSIIFKLSGKDSWISMFIGMLIGSSLIYMFNKTCFNKNKNYILNEKINKFKKTLISIFFIFIIFSNILIVRIFATSFFLTKTPGLFITIPFLFLAYLNSKKGIKTISKISEILMPISMFVILITIITTLKDGSISSFLPVLSSSKKNILLASFYFAIFTAMPQLLLFDIKIDEKEHVKYYIQSSLISILIGIGTIYVLGPYLIKIFRFPEYMVLKQIKLFNFIEKVENLIGLIWFFNLFICSSISIYNLEKINKNKTYLIIITILYIIEFVTNNYEYATIIYKYLPIILLILGIVFFITIYSITRKIKKVAKAT